MGDMILAQIKVEEENLDEQMQLMAWQTALLMNSTGNYKKKIKPKDLYTPMAEINEQEEKQNNLSGSDAKKKLQEELLSTFADSDMVIK